VQVQKLLQALQCCCSASGYVDCRSIVGGPPWSFVQCKAVNIISCATSP
jgi:hypothetical protein